MSESIFPAAAEAQKAPAGRARANLFIITNAERMTVRGHLNPALCLPGMPLALACYFHPVGDT
jgi:hypothetical protein